MSSTNLTDDGMSHAETRLFEFSRESEIYFELIILLSCSQGRIFNSNFNN